jgi:hypothetical protein
MTSTGDSQQKDPYADHRVFVLKLKDEAPIGSVTLMHRLGMKQPGRFRRVRNSLIGMNVVRFQGGRGASRSLVLGDVDFEEALEQGFDVRPGREIALYPLLMDPIDQLVTDFHINAGHDLVTSEERDGVTPYNTSARAAKYGEGAFTRPDVTVVADLKLDSGFMWTDIHAVEVKPYWSVGRDGLFEAAAQAALQRSSFAWLVAYIPSLDSPGLSRVERAQCETAYNQLTSDEGALFREARAVGIGVAVARELGGNSPLELVTPPRRLAMDPHAVGQLFESLHL